MTETITTLSLDQADLESPRQVQFLDGTVFWICPRCNGFYNTREQATLILEHHPRQDQQYHRCKSRPPQNRNRRCESCGVYNSLDRDHCIRCGGIFH